MKNIILFLLPLMALITIAACQESHAGHAAAVQLDNGNRWQANPETTAGIAKMQAILTNYEGRSGAEDRKAMRTELEAAFQDIFAQCTMKGEAHEQLHNYLFPMKDLFDRIERSEGAVEELEKYLGEYSSYFE